MINLLIKDVKLDKDSIETFTSKDKAEARLIQVDNNPKKWKLMGVACDSMSEKSLAEPYLIKKSERDMYYER